MPATCPSDNTLETDQSSFWSSGDVNWDAHRIGWAISGGCAVLTVLISMYSVYTHARHYHIRREQRQIIRILYMPPVYAIISFFSFRFFRSYTYYELIEVVYEAVTISAFMLLIEEYVAATASGGSVMKALERKDKRSLPFPFCHWRYRPTKPYFMHAVTWSVMQYVIVRPLVSVVAIIAQAKNVLCENGGFNFHFVYSYVEIVDFISISVALYGLIIFYGLTHSELVGRRPLAKFLSIKLIVMFTFYQSFVFSLLEGRVIHATKYWTETNIADGLTALTICIEMVFFAILMLWAYPASEYRNNELKNTNIFRALWDSINFSDFAVEIIREFKFFFDYLRNKPGTHSRHFGNRPADERVNNKSEVNGTAAVNGNGFSNGDPSSRSGVSHPYLSQLDDGVVEPNSPSTGLPMHSLNNGSGTNALSAGSMGRMGGNRTRAVPEDEYSDNVRLTAYRNNPYDNLERESAGTPFPTGRPSDVDESRGLYTAEPMSASRF